MTPCSDGFGQICTVLDSILGRISALCYCPRLSSNWCSFSIAMVMRLLKTMVLPIFLAPHHRIQLPLTSIRSSLFSHWGDGRGRGSQFSSLEAGSGEEERMDIQNCFIIAFKTKLNPTKKKPYEITLLRCMKLGFTPCNRGAGLCSRTHANSQLDLSFCFYFAVFVIIFF